MELGKARLRKVGINNLNRAVHPDHGVMWTDGRGIYLAPLYVEGKQMQNATSVRLGEFDTVTSVHWSIPTHQDDGDNGTSCHMAVVHQHNVTVWRVSGALPRLSFKQVRKINVRPIAQGCLWNHTSDTLCLLSRHQCSFYFRHDHNKGSYAVPPLDSGKISCGCWSSDGKKLIVCIGASLLVYRWPEISSSDNDGAVFTWVIPGLEGEIISVSPMPKNTIVVATEVPLERLCRKQDSQDAFVIPDGSKSNMLGEDDIIRPSNSPSVTQGLLNLQTNKQFGDASASLVLIKLHESNKEFSKIFTCPVNGLLTPDILLYEKSSQCVVVGSNSQSQLHIYALLEKRLAYCGDIQLDKTQRPKGLCSVPTYFDERGAALLILVGQRSGEDASIPSSSTETEFQLSLKYIIIKAGYEGKNKKDTSHGDSFKARSASNILRSGGSSINKSESMRERNSSVGEGAQRPRSGSSLSELTLSTHPSSSSTPPPSSSIEVRGHTLHPSHGNTSPYKESSPQRRISTNTPSSPSRSSSSSPSVLVQQPSAVSLSLTSNSSSSHQRAPIIEDLSDQNGSALTREDLEVDTVPFSSQPPSFSNDKLSSKYELNNSASTISNPQTNVNSVREKDRKTIIHTSDSSKVNSHARLNGEMSSKSLTQLSDRQMSTSSPKSQSLQRIKQKQLEWLGAYKSEASGLDRVGGERPRLKSAQSLEGEATKPSPGRRRGASVTKEEVNILQNDLNKDEMTSDLGSSSHSADSSFDSMEKQVRHQKDNIEALYRRLEELSSAVQEASMIFPTKYQDIQTPDLVTVTYTSKDNNDSIKERKKFLLDNGRLQLEPVKLAFGLATVELWLDGIPIILGCNIDGYIPIKFSSGASLQISGIPAKTTLSSPSSS